MGRLDKAGCHRITEVTPPLLERAARERAVGACGPPRLLPELSRGLPPVPGQWCTPTHSHGRYSPNPGQKPELPGPHSRAGGTAGLAAKPPAQTFTLPQEKVAPRWLLGRRGDVC